MQVHFSSEQTIYIVSGLSGLLAASGGLLSRDLLPTTTFPISYFGVSRKAVEAAAASEP